MIERFAGRFALLRRLGRGGMGEVYLARDLATGAECALKRLSLRSPSGFPEAARHEFETLTRVRHPEVVAVYELGFAPDGTGFYTMEYVPGLSAEAALERGDWPALMLTASRVAHALEALHAAGVTHGDLKPSNILVVPSAQHGALPSDVRLVDFGLASLRGRDQGGYSGTPGYAAPEVVGGQSPGAVSDLYGFGATLYALATGQPPFGSDPASKVLARQRAGPPPALPLEEAGTPSALVQLILQLMAHGAGDRPRDAREVLRELERMHPAARRPLEQRLHAAVVVGRERELARLERSLAAAARRSRVTLITGDAGAGKSALLGELAARAALAGHRVVRLSCAAFEGSGTVAGALLRRFAAEAGVESADPRLAPPTRAVLAEEQSMQESDLTPLAEAALGWIRALTAGHSADAGAASADGRDELIRAPVVLLDDAERLDPISRAFVQRVMLGDAPALWVLAGRAEPAGLGPGDRALVDAGVAELQVLGPLEPEAIARLAAVRIGEPPTSILSKFLVARAGGHPGLTVELLRLAAASGALRQNEDGVIVNPDQLETLRTPEHFETALLERLSALPVAARAAALTLAAWGRAIEPERLAADQEAIATLESAGLAARGIDGRITLTPQALADRVLESTPELERNAVVGAVLAWPHLSTRERFRLHRLSQDPRAALEAAESAFESSPDERLAAEAAALAELISPALAALWHERAARRLMARGRYDAAAPHLERSLALEPAAESRHERRWMLSSACLRSGRGSDAEREIERALADAPPALWRARLLSNECVRQQGLGNFIAAAEVAARALADAEHADDATAIAGAIVVLAYSLLTLGRVADAEEWEERAESAAERSGQPIARVRARGLRAAVAHARGQLTRAEKIYDEALALARAAGDPIAAEEVIINLAVVRFELGRWSEVRDLYRAFAKVALEEGRPRAAANAIAGLAQGDGLMGRPASARRRARNAIRLARAHVPRGEAYAWRSLAQAHRIAGRLRRAERAARRAIALATRDSLVAELEWCRLELARTFAVAGRWSEVGELLDRALESAPSRGSVGTTLMLTLAGRAALRRGDLDLANARLDSADQWLHAREAPYAAAHAYQLRTEIALTRGRIREGTECARRALEAFAALPAPADRALAALDFARLAPQGEEARSAAGRWLEGAAQAFERLGDLRNRERALSMMVQWLRSAPSHAPAALRERSLIESVSWLLNSLSDLGQLTQRAMQMAVEQLGAERGVLLLVDPESGQLTPMAEHGAVDATTRRDALGYSRRVVQRVTESGRGLLIADAPSDPQAFSASVRDMRLRSIVCVPMFLGGRVVGAVYLDDSRRADAFGDADRGVLEGFAQLMAVAIEKSRGDEEVQRAIQKLADENLSLRREMGARFRVPNVVGSSSQMQQVLGLVERAALTDTTVLISGENGTGKELIARALHHSGKRRTKPFIPVNCGAFPETLIESELFGILSHVATGVRAREGRFVQADSGALFLDEIGDMPLKQQVTLLSAIANREVVPVGGGKPIPVDVRIIAASNRDLRRMVQQGTFREDLYYRLNVIEIRIPPLRERKADIPALAHHFLQHFARQQERELPELAPTFLAALAQSDWPGNVRELQNYIERVLAMNPGKVLHPDPLPRDLEERGKLARPINGRRLIDAVDEIARKMLSEALEKSGGNQSLAARELGITEQTLRYRVRKYGLERVRKNRRIRKNRR